MLESELITQELNDYNRQLKEKLVANFMAANEREEDREVESDRM
jgi:hypothetical protein